MEDVKDYCIIKEVFHLFGPNLGGKEAVKLTFRNPTL